MIFHENFSRIKNSKKLVIPVSAKSGSAPADKRESSILFLCSYGMFGFSPWGMLQNSLYDIITLFVVDRFVIAFLATTPIATISTFYLYIHARLCEERSDEAILFIGRQITKTSSTTLSSNNT